MELEGEYKPPKADKQDYAVAKYLYDHLALRIGDLHGMEVLCFYAEDAVNCLLDSQWATGKTALFTDRQSVVDFCHEMLCKELFHRAYLVKRKPKTSKLTDGNDTPGESGTESKKSKKKPKLKEIEPSKDSKADDGKADDSKKPKKVKKLKLGMSDDQCFYDGSEIYVWIYEPVSWKKFLIGFAILTCAIAMCCYPLWPEWMRIGVYYLSLAGAGFLGVILSLAILRYIVWAIIYALSMKKHSFFLFPNLTEDCGFFESFVPLYEYSKLGEEKAKKSRKSKEDTDPAESPEETQELESTEPTEDNLDEKDASDDSQPSDFEVIQESELTN